MFSDLQHFKIKQDANRANGNYRQDCLIRQRYGMSYECYIKRVIDSVIEAQQYATGGLSGSIFTVWFPLTC